MYWTDWGSVPFIGRVGMDGTDMSKIITSGLYHPWGITVDFQSDHIFWVDGHLGFIEYEPTTINSTRFLASCNVIYSLDISSSHLRKHTRGVGTRLKVVSRLKEKESGRSSRPPLFSKPGF